MTIMIVTTILHFWWCTFYVNILKLDVLGLSLATMMTYFSNFVFVTIYCNLSKDLKSSYFGFTSDCFTDLKEYIKLMILSALMTQLEWTGYELILLLSGYLSM